MSYVDQNLLPNEHMTYRAHLHWAIYLPAVVILVIAIMMAVSVSAAGDGGSRGAMTGFLFIVGALLALSAWIRVKTSEFAVTNKRVLIKVGLVRRRSLELLLRQVETIGVEQGILGRIFGYGIIVIGGTGGTKEPFKSISDPLEFRKQVQIQSTTNEAPAPTMQASSGPEKVCPRCAETVKAAARACRFCNHEFA